MPVDTTGRLAVEDLALFLDIDGTLAEFRSDPGSVLLEPALLIDLAALRLRLGGAIALVSGRSLEQIDRLVAPLALPAAGLHGFERRDAAGRVYRPELLADLSASRNALSAALADWPGASLEDKGPAIAVHFRDAPQHGPDIAAFLDQLVARLQPEFERLEGDQVVEIKPAAQNKGSAVAAFMREEPFVGRTPVFVGDDYTDADAFAAVRRLGGLAIAVGNRVRERHRLEHPAAVRAWLRNLLTAEDARP
ncbi:MAG: trehalose-phosphatase [Steroidobacteraceae bacterium]